MTRYLRMLGAALLVATLAACGGGGGSGGANPNSGGSTGGTGGAGGVDTTDPTGGSQTTTAGSISLEIRSAAGASTTQINGTEQARAVATVTGPDGNPVNGVIVVFSQADADLLTISPGSGTALTVNGQASVDIKAANSSQTGAVTVVAQVLFGTTTLSARKSIQISGTAGTVEAPRSLLFLEANPTSIVIKGAGGAGRSESATLRYRVVNSANTPIQGAVVNFTVDNPNVTLNITQATSDAEGIVTTTVTSGTVPASVVVTATAAANAQATVPSSTLSVSNGLTVVGGFEIVAAEYNLDGGFTGDTTTVSAFLRDANGNPVPDGTVVSFTTDLGAVGTSSAGACNTVNGTCTVPFRVQEPRGNGLATVIGTVQLPGNPNPLADALRINMSASATARALSALPGTVATQLTLAGKCKDTFTLFAADVNGRSLAAGTSVSARAAGNDVSVSIDNGSPILDQLDANFTPTTIRVAVDATSADPACNAAGGGQAVTDFELVFQSPNGQSTTQTINIRYPR